MRLRDDNPPPATISFGDLSPGGFNYPAGFGPWYTVESLVFSQEGAPGDVAVGTLELAVRGAATSVTGTGTSDVYVLPADADITLHLEGDDFTWSASLDDATRTNDTCVEGDGSTRRLCRVGETKRVCDKSPFPLGEGWGEGVPLLTQELQMPLKTATYSEKWICHTPSKEEKYKWQSDPLPSVLADGEKVIVRLRYSAPRAGQAREAVGYGANGQVRGAGGEMDRACERRSDGARLRGARVPCPQLLGRGDQDHGRLDHAPAGAAA